MVILSRHSCHWDLSKDPKPKPASSNGSQAAIQAFLNITNSLPKMRGQERVSFIWVMPAGLRLKVLTHHAGSRHQVPGQAK